MPETPRVVPTVTALAPERASREERGARPAPMEGRRPAPVEPPRVVVMQQPTPQPASASVYGYPPSAPQPYPAWGGGPAYPAVAAPLMPRKFTVIGGVGDLEESTLQSLEVE